ncbi:MAG TPA: class I tRNA ligase family protein, partial [Gammaproteobacteria bacterium]|nr:class I tRNA ligase family protein [Gammaproteobacteria bacterium]
ETLQKVTDDVGRRYTFNTAIAAIMELINDLTSFTSNTEIDKSIKHETLEIVLQMLSPIVPHITHHLWHALGHESTIADAVWPQVDLEALIKESIELVIQVNGKVRGKLEVPIHADQKAIESAVIENDNVKKHIEGKNIKKIIIIPNKLINIVAH